MVPHGYPRPIRFLSFSLQGHTSFSTRSSIAQQEKVQPHVRRAEARFHFINPAQLTTWTPSLRCGRLPQPLCSQNRYHLASSLVFQTLIPDRLTDSGPYHAFANVPPNDPGRTHSLLNHTTDQCRFFSGLPLCLPQQNPSGRGPRVPSFPAITKPDAISIRSPARF